MIRPQNKTLRQVIEHLESIGLSVYGPNVDVETGLLYHSLKDYNAEDAIKYRRLYEHDEIEDSEEMCRD